MICKDTHFFSTVQIFFLMLSFFTPDPAFCTAFKFPLSGFPSPSFQAPFPAPFSRCYPLVNYLSENFFSLMHYSSYLCKTIAN